MGLQQLERGVEELGPGISSDAAGDPASAAADLAARKRVAVVLVCERAQALAGQQRQQSTLVERVGKRGR